MFAFFVTSLDQAQTLQSSTDALSSLKLALVIIFILTFLVGLLNLLYYMMVKHSPDLSFKFLLPNFRFSPQNVRFELEDSLGRPLNFTRLTIFKGDQIFKTYYFAAAFYKIRLPQGVYKATVSKFGYSDSSTDSFKIDDKIIDFNLTLQRTTEARQSKTIITLAKATFASNILMTIIWLITLSNVYTSVTLPIQMIIIAAAVFSAYLAIRYYDILSAIKLINFKSRPIASKKVTISDRNNQPICDLTSDKKGLLHIMISPGIYRFAPEDYTHRIIKVNESGLGHLKIKF